jgi:CheY-like chemotaxis protein
LSSAEAAREHLGEPGVFAPVLMIVDMHLGGAETGLDFLGWLRRQPPPLGSTPALMLSGSAREQDRADSGRHGAMAFLHKPVTEGILISAVQALGFVIVTSLTAGQMAIRTIERR